MSKIKFVLRQQRGFLLLNVIFLTVITSFAAMILLNAAVRVRNPQPTLELTALYLANEQFAVLESRAAAGEQIGGSYSFLGRSEDLTSENLSEKNLVTFTVETQVSGSGNLREAKVTVKWNVGGRDNEFKTKRTIRINQ